MESLERPPLLHVAGALPPDLWARVAVAAGLHGLLCLCSTGRGASAVLCRPTAKHLRFWSEVLRVAASAGVEAQLAAFERAQAVARALPPENAHVAELLLDAATRLRRASRAVFMQRVEAESLSLELLAGGGVDECSSGCLLGLLFAAVEQGRGWQPAEQGPAVAVARLLEKEVPDQLQDLHLALAQEQALSRQRQVLPLLRGTAEQLSGVLEDCRSATKSAFDVRKYDIYNRGVARTPPEASEAADRLVEVSREVHKAYMGLIVGMVTSLSRDALAASADATEALLAEPGQP